MTARGLMRRFQELLGPVNRLPSWANEWGGGVLLFAAAWGVTALAGLLFAWPSFNVRLLAALTVAMLLSEWYERKADPWGYNPLDVVQRIPGIVLAALVVALLYPHALAAASYAVE